MAVGGGEGEDIPGVGGDYVGGYEVDFVGGVGLAVGVEVAFVGVSAFVGGAFDLDAEEASVVVDGEVVGGGVSPGLAEAESVLGGAGHEAHFCPLSSLFGVRDGEFGFSHGIVGRKKAARKVAASENWFPW